MMTPTKSLVLFALCSSLLSCSQSDEESTDVPDSARSTIEPDTAAYTVTDTTKYKFDFAVANIPSPATGVEELNSFGVPYSSEFLHDPELADRYSNEQKRAVNLGIYNIDMAYAMLNDRGQDVLNYMKSVLFVGDQLGLRNSLQSMVGKRAEANLNRRDSLFKLLDEIYAKSDSYLRNNDRVYTASMIFTGSWLESLYLTCKISNRADEKSNRQSGRRIIWEQRFHLGNLISILNDYKDKSENAELLAELKIIHGEISAVKQPEAMEDREFVSISEKIAAVRNRFTKS